MCIVLEIILALKKIIMYCNAHILSTHIKRVHNICTYSDMLCTFFMRVDTVHNGWWLTFDLPCLDSYLINQKVGIIMYIGPFSVCFCFKMTRKLIQWLHFSLSKQCLLLSYLRRFYAVKILCCISQITSNQKTIKIIKFYT